MNKRQNNLLIEIADVFNGTLMTLQDFARDYDVSEQTIKNDIKEINHILQEKQQPLILIKNSGEVRFESFVDLSFVDEVNYYTYKLSQSERKTILALLLLTMNRYTTIAELSEKIMVSRNTLISDLDDLKDWFKENELSLVSQPRKGLLVTGSEECIRAGILKLLLLNDLVHEHEVKSENDIFHTLLLQEVDSNNQSGTIKRILLEAEERHDIFLTDFSFREMSYFLLVLVIRLQKQKSSGEVDPAKWENVHKSSKYAIADDIFQSLCAAFDLKPPHMRSELADIIERLRCESYIKNNAASLDGDMIDIQILINEFIYKISQDFNIHYYLNFYLYDLLLTHMKTVAYRLKQKHSLSNPMREQLEREYADMFARMHTHLRPLETFLGAEISKDEISFIVMYLLAILEKNKVTDISIETLLVCNTGRGSAQLILAKLSSMFGQVRVVDVVSTHRLRDMSLQDIDLVLSTVPLGSMPMPHAQITPLLTDSDIAAIQNVILQVQNRKRKAYGQPQAPRKEFARCIDESILQEGVSLRDLLTAERVLLNARAADWKEAVALSGEILCRAGVVEERYIQAMIRNIQENGPYVVIFPGIAIPHADQSNGALQPAAGFVRLREPVHFHHAENDPVRFVIAFSVIDSGSIGRALYNLTKMLSSDNFLPNLEQAKDAAELLEHIQTYESKIDVTGR